MYCRSINVCGFDLTILQELFHTVGPLKFKFHLLHFSLTRAFRPKFQAIVYHVTFSFHIPIMNQCVYSGHPKHGYKKEIGLL